MVGSGGRGHVTFLCNNLLRHFRLLLLKLNATVWVPPLTQDLLFYPCLGSCLHIAVPLLHSIRKLEEIRKERKENGGGTSGFEREFEGFGFLSENL